MNMCLFSVILICVLVINIIPTQAVKCTNGQTKRNDCNNCSCQKGKWACSTMRCSPRQQCISGQVKHVDCNDCYCMLGKWQCTTKDCPKKAKRDVPVAADLKHTPCAPNDYFKLDCNTCYCNIEKTGYLCTENLCSFTESSSAESNDTLLVNQTSVVDVVVPQIETVILNSTVASIIDNNSTKLLGNATNNLVLEPLLTATNLTSLDGNNSTTYFHTADGGDTGQNSTHSD